MLLYVICIISLHFTNKMHRELIYFENLPILQRSKILNNYKYWETEAEQTKHFDMINKLNFLPQSKN